MFRYTTVQGDMWDSMAKSLYGSEKYAGQLMQANPAHIATVVFSSGVVLAVPVIDMTVTADTSSLPPWRA